MAYNHENLGWAGKLTQLTPLWDATKLGTLRNTKGFHKWDLIGLSQLGDLWKGGSVVGFDYLQQQYRYIQIKHAIETNIPRGTILPVSLPLEVQLLTDHLQKRAISLTYKKIINNRLDPLQHL